MSKKKRNYRVYLDDILDAVARIQSYTKEGRRQFFADMKTQDAVIRQFMIVGEASARLPSSWKVKYAHIPWKKAIGMRNFLIHEYDDTNLQKVWGTVKKDLLPLRETVQIMIEDPFLK